MMKIWRRTPQPTDDAEVLSVMQQSNAALEAAKRQATEAEKIATGLFAARKQNHFAERIRKAYEIEGRR